MSLGRRLLNLARAEIYDAARRIVGEQPGRGRDATAWSFDDEPSDDQPSRSQRPEPEAFTHPETAPLTPEQDRIHRYYANLELPVGAPRVSVKAAYRRLVRLYHPDRHHSDVERQATATKLLLELRKAYEGLLAHLDEEDSKRDLRRDRSKNRPPDAV
ncbi:MAG: J domain-containing protein [Deltaproteobacteria bacterium]|nr:J domain-containing protein [Deltaproteobacteria bacterium]